MEENVTQPTPMGHIWFMICMSGLFVFGVSWFWHWSEMHAVETQNQKENVKIEKSIVHLSAYRDVYKEKGKDAAALYVQELQKTPYGI